MIKIENVSVYGWEAAIRGMRNPLNSWDKSDSAACYNTSCEECLAEKGCDFFTEDEFVAGENDLALMKQLVKVGTDHRKFMRFITVTCDITAPLYWWKEADTYKVGTVSNSCSTMHTLPKKEFTLDDFSHEHLVMDRDQAGSELLNADGKDTSILVTPKALLKITIGCLNNCRMMFLKTKEKFWWWQMIQLLPSSYNQRRTVLLNYEVLMNMYHARKNHKLDEWCDFCGWVESLPYMGVFLNA